MILGQELPVGRGMYCFLHKRERATHLCIDLSCHHNPIICNLCLSEGKHRGMHSTHQNALLRVNQGVQSLAARIKAQTKTVDALFERTIGNKDYDAVRNYVERDSLFAEEVQEHVKKLKAQLDLETGMLIKEFHKQVLIEKQECIRKLEDYRRRMVSNIEVVRKEFGELITFQSSLKYFANVNNFIVKLANGSERRNLEWLVSQKKVLLKVGNILDSSYNNSLLGSFLNLAKNNIQLPYWRSNHKETDFRREIHDHIFSFLELPQLIDLQQKSDISNKHIFNYMPSS